MNFLEIINNVYSFFGIEAWMIKLFFVVILTGLLNWFQKKLHNGIILKLEKTKTFWDDAFFDAIKKPLSYLIWFSGIAFAIGIAGDNLRSIQFISISPIYQTSVLFLICWSETPDLKPRGIHLILSLLKYLFEQNVLHTFVQFS